MNARGTAVTVWFALIVVTTAGCSHYGWTEERATVAQGEPTIAVETVSADASEQLHLERLTRRLVRGLRSEGLAGAAWTDSDGEDRVRCALRNGRVTGFGDQWSGSISVVCRVQCAMGEHETRRTAHAIASRQPAAGHISQARRRVLESAAHKALRHAARDVAAYCKASTAPERG